MVKFELAGVNYVIDSGGKLNGPRSRKLARLQRLWEKYSGGSPDRGAKDYQFFEDEIQPVGGKLIEFKYTDKKPKGKDIVY